MSSISFVDDFLTPQTKLYIMYDGAEPFGTTEVVKETLKYLLNVTTKDTREEDVRWDITDEMREFYFIFKAVKMQDRWSIFHFRVIIHGFQSAKTRHGNVKVEISGWLETKYEYSNFIQRGLWWFFDRMFYYKQRRRYIDEGRDVMYKLKRAVQDKLGITPPA